MAKEINVHVSNEMRGQSQASQPVCDAMPSS